MTKQNNKHQDEREELYEIGYLVVPSVAEEQLPGVVQEVKGILEKHGAVVSKEGLPVLTDLAYEIAKVSVGKRQGFNRAYFGWITFKAAPENAPLIKKQIDILGDILRFILIKTDEQIVIAPTFDMDEPKADAVSLETPASETKLVEEDLDKKIDNLVVA